jgi:mxaK protein
MRRLHGHLIFAAVAAALSVVTGTEILQLVHAQEINASIRDGGAPEVPEGRLTRAVALSKKDYDGALATYKAIVQSGREDLRRVALYDLGNLHLQQALRVGQSDEEQSLPLIELAKQSYRDELRRNPNDWDARYNLERALRLAPEEDEDYEDTGPPTPKEQERSTIADPRMDLP